MEVTAFDRLLTDRRIPIVRRELGSLGREKTIVLALLIQLFIAVFSSYLVVGLVALSDPGASEGATVEVAITGEARDELATLFEEHEPISTRVTGDRSTAEAAFERGSVDATIVATRTTDGRLHVRITVPRDSLRVSIIVLQLREALEKVEHRQRVRNADRLRTTPVPIPDAPNASPYFGFTYTILVPLLFFLPAFISGSLIVDSITEELERGTLELLRVTPLSTTEIVDGKSFAAIGIVPAQVILWLGLLHVNGIHVKNVFLLLVLSTAVTTVVVSLGAAVGIGAADRRRAQFLYSIGVIALFAAALLLPEQPANTVARLAIGSGAFESYLMVGVYCLLAVMSYGSVRFVADRWRH